ncbi:MAG: methyl-accepting chemotaxis protein [Dechloromonas sp.]|nr:MAG: methyl-accepting chemotaxis protein [Dechloromonas sp.]
MDIKKLFRRGLLVATVIALGAAITVYVLFEWFHRTFSPSPFVDSIGTMVVVMVTFFGQHLVSLAVYRDGMLGMNTALTQDENRLGNFHKVADEVADELKQVAHFNEVVRSQLKHVIEETEKAALGIVERLQTIDSVITKLENFVTGTADQAATITHDAEIRIQRNQAMVVKMGAYVQQRLQESEEDQQRVAHVVKEAYSLESLIQLIKQVAGQTNLLALNAAIEAARAGEAGRGFAVVADEVRKLSGETENAVAKISEGIQSVAKSIELQFQAKLSSVNRDKEKAVLGEFSAQLNELGDSYEKLIRHETETLGEVQSSSRQLAEMFLATQASVQFQDVTRQQIEQVVQALNQLDEHTGLLAERLRAYEDPGFIYQPIAKHLEALYSRYVMESQRSTHHSALKMEAAGAAAGARIELF